MNALFEELSKNPGAVAIFGTVFGGVGLKVVEHWLGRAKEREDANIAMREELRIELSHLRDRLAQSAQEEQRLEALVDKWQGAYYDLRDEKQRLVTELMIALEKLKTLEHTLEAKARENGIENGV